MQTGVSVLQNPGQALVDCLTRIGKSREQFRFVLLRHQSFDLAEAIDRGDVDLLGSEESSTALIRFVAELSRQGLCHYRVAGARREKLQLTLFSVDGRHHIRLDLWTRLRQFASHNLTLTIEACEPLLQSGSGPFLRLPLKYEVAVYVQHLVAREKAITSPQVQNRLQNYIRQLKEQRAPEMARQLEFILANRLVSGAVLDYMLTVLRPFLIEDKNVPGLTWRERKEKILCGWLRPFRRPGAIAIIGCDGAGKTSISKALRARPDSPFAAAMVGRKLYQHSLFYYLFTALGRRLLGIRRDEFEARFGTPLYLVAAWHLQLRLIFRRLIGRKKPVVIDRSLTDFLMTSRKTDHPQLLPGSQVRHVIGERIPVIHLWVDHQTLASRKQEMTDQGHAVWDQIMFTEHTGRLPTDYLGFYNGHPFEFSVDALARIIAHEWPVSGKQPEPETSSATPQPLQKAA
ncbi:hypothetical protein [Planctomicrobium sp. SH664]|uniref:hypothetical protein n=1 Tax=Planctomicrobium sp. SH664 TaxID=3448125 RepID=UPI003F5AF217